MMQALARRNWQRGDSGSGKLFWRVLAWRKLVFRLVELVKQSKRRNCEDENIVTMMCIGKKAGRVVLPCFSVLQTIAKMVCTW
jgi:hypothetical protein